MKTRILIATSAFALIGALVACGDKPEPTASSAPASSTQSKPAQSATATASAAAAASAAPTSSAAVASTDVPTQADFEEEAEGDIGTDNFSDELTALEKEIDAK